jgi:hypothetical protein
MKYLHPRSMYTLPHGGVQRGSTPSMRSREAIPSTGGFRGKRAPNRGLGAKPRKAIFIHFGLFSHLQNITKTLTLLTLGFSPMHVLFFLQLSLPAVHAFLHSCMLIFCQLSLQFSACFLSHDRPSFHFGLVPTGPQH